MDLTASQSKHDGAIGEFRELKERLQAMGGPALLGFVTGPVYKTIKARSELVRDVAAAKAQAVLEQEALRFLSMTGEEKEEAVRFLSENPVVYLRTLTKRLTQDIHALPVADRLTETIRNL